MTLQHAIINALTQGPSVLSDLHTSWAESCVKGAGALVDANLSAHIQASCNDDDDFWPSEDSWLSSYRPYIVREGVLYVPVKGVLINNFSYTLGDFLTGYNYITRAVLRGRDDENVKSILLVCDTPGGAVSGCDDTAALIFETRSVKPIEAVAADYAASAGYWLASATSKITVARTGAVGSIGVVTWHVSYEKALSDAGIKFTAIHAGKNKVDGNPYQDLSDEVKASIQKRIDSIYDLFVASAARGRGMSEQAVRDTQAQVYSAAEAVENGLADAVGNIVDCVKAMAESNAATITFDEETVMTDATTVTLEAHNAAVTTARAEGVTAGATAERARVSAILSCEDANGREATALALAMNSDMSAEAAANVLKATPKAAAPAAASTFDADMAAGGNPNVPSAGPGGVDDATKDVDAIAALGVSMRGAAKKQ